MQELADVYARALFEVAEEHGELERMHEELGQFADALTQSAEIRMFFFSPYFSSEEKRDGVKKVIEGGDERLINFLQPLAERHRMPAIHRIRRRFDELWAEENKLLTVQVTSAIDLDEGRVRPSGGPPPPRGRASTTSGRGRTSRSPSRSRAPSTSTRGSSARSVTRSPSKRGGAWT